MAARGSSTSEPRAYRPAWAWTGERWERAPVVCVDGGGRVVPHRGEPVRDVDGLLVPGFVNAHCHLELPAMATPPGIGLPTWVRVLRATVAPSAAQAGAGVYAAVRAGTAALADVGNAGLSAPAMAAARLPGRVFAEVVGIELEAVPPVEGRPVPHAPHSTSAAVIRACAAVPGPWTIHFDEDPAEAEFLATGGGPWAEYQRSLGRDPSRLPVAGVSPARWLARLGVLSPRAILVHAVCTRGDDLDVVAASGARVALCPRSNLRIGGRLPDVEGILARGIPVCLGTDSLASAPDLDPLGEAAALRRAFPRVAPDVWLAALTAGGADALDLPLGRLEGAPGLLVVDAPSPEALLDGTPWPRRWLSCPRS